MSYLQVRQLDLAYKETKVVKNFNLKLQAGTMHGLIGPNGSGKTTVLRALAGLLSPRHGEIRIDDENLRQISKQRRARMMGWVPQRESLAWSLTVEELVALGRAPHRGWMLPYTKEDREKIRLALASAELHDYALRPVDELSGGEFQRVLIARALAQEPKILLLDEPTANLDIHHQIQVLDLVQNLVKKEKMTAIIAIHDLSLAARYCDRLTLLDRGEIRCVGSPKQVLAPENLSAVFGVDARLYRDPLGYWALSVRNTAHGFSRIIS
jgi:iron complex transport system ATP-binding protein